MRKRLCWSKVPQQSAILQISAGKVPPKGTPTALPPIRQKHKQKQKAVLRANTGFTLVGNLLVCRLASQSPTIKPTDGLNDVRKEGSERLFDTRREVEIDCIWKNPPEPLRILSCALLRCKGTGKILCRGWGTSGPSKTLASRPNLLLQVGKGVTGLQSCGIVGKHQLFHRGKWIFSCAKPLQKCFPSTQVALGRILSTPDRFSLHL